MDWLQQDLRSAARGLKRTPVLTFALIATLALAIGANTAVFSIVQAVLLRALPVTTPSQLYFVAHGVTEPLSTSSHYPWFERVSRQTDVFSGVAAYHVRDFKVASGRGIERVVGQYVSGTYHAVVGVPFHLGRGFSREHDRAFNPIAVISDGYWAARFGRGEDVIGRTLTVGGHAVTIVGVTAAGFHGMVPGQQIDVTLPLSMRVQDDPEFLAQTDTWTSMPLVVRLASGVDPSQARAVIASVYRDYMMLPDNQRYSRTADGQLRTATLLPAAQGSDRMRRTYDTPLRVLMGMVGLILLIACVNVANLLLMRAPVRAREVALRMALGASRPQVIRQLLTESVLLACCGGALGLLLAAWGTRFVSLLFGTSQRPILMDLQPDSGVLLFAAAVSVVTGVIFGLAPAWRTVQIDLAPTLQGARVPSAAYGRSGRHVLVVVQIVISLVLLFGAGLLAATLDNLRHVDGGFRTDSVVLFELDARDTMFPRARLPGLCDSVLDRVRAHPGVAAASCSTMSPVATNSEGRSVTVPGFTSASPSPIVYANSIDAGYFDTLDVALVRGRGVSAHDTATSNRVAVLSESMARYYFGDADPIGRTFTFGRAEGATPITIVGVARDVRQQLRDAPPHMAYTPLTQRDEPPSGLLAAVRTAAVPSSSVAAAVRDDVRALTSDVAVTYVRTMDEQIDAALISERLLAVLSGAFAALALALACVGLFGVVSYGVSRRMKEIGIRIALGATGARMLGRVLGQACLITAIGLIAGVPISMATARLLEGVLFGLTPADARTLMLAVGVLTATALVAAYLPAHRAARVDPAITLRDL